MEKVDLFEIVVKYLAVKPLTFDEYDFERAQTVIRQDKQGLVTFIGEHDYFEKSLEAMVEKVAQIGTKTGTIYIDIKGTGCSDRIKRRLFDLAASADTVIIFGDPARWPEMSTNIKFSARDDIFADNHQRFFIYHSSGYNIALVSRHHTHEGIERTEAVITNDPAAVSLLGVTIGTKAYPLV